MKIGTAGYEVQAQSMVEVFPFTITTAASLLDHPTALGYAVVLMTRKPASNRLLFFPVVREFLRNIHGDGST